MFRANKYVCDLFIGLTQKDSRCSFSHINVVSLNFGGQCDYCHMSSTRAYRTTIDTRPTSFGETLNLSSFFHYFGKAINNRKTGKSEFPKGYKHFGDTIA